MQSGIFLLSDGMDKDLADKSKPGLVKSLFRVVGRAGSTVGGVAGDVLRTAGQTAKDVGGRASLTFSKELEETPDCSLRELGESLVRWLVQEHDGRADLQQQKPSTVELSEMGQAGSYEVTLEEPGILGRTFRIVLRQRPLAELAENFPPRPERFHAEVLLVQEWPKTLEREPKGQAVMVWDQAAVLGTRNPALDIAQGWLKSAFGGTLRAKTLLPKKRPQPAARIPIWGRDSELEAAVELFLTPRHRREQQTNIVSLAAPGGTGKSFFLKVLRSRLGHRVRWAGVDHHGIDKAADSSQVLAKLLASLAKQLSEQSIPMEAFGKELHAFRKQSADGSKETSGFLGHMKKAVESAAGANPVWSATSAGVAFLASWRQQSQEVSEALAKDDALQALTEAFKADLLSHAIRARESLVCWPRPVLVFDTYEWLAPLVDSWLRTDFLTGELLETDSFMLLVSGREPLLQTDTRWSEWQHQTLTITLHPLAPDAAAGYLQSLNVTPERFDSLYELTGGLPLFLSLSAHIGDPDQAVIVLARRVLEEVPQEVHHHFLRASLLDGFERDRLQRLFSDIAAEQLETLTGWLHGATFTVAQGGRRAFLPSVRRILRRALQLELGSTEVARLQSQSSAPSVS